MKTLRLLYPDYLSGGLTTYYFGANLLSHFLPHNENQPVFRVNITPPDDIQRTITQGIYARDEVIAGIQDAQKILHREKPQRVITIGGSCIVSAAPFDYLHGLYENLGIVWIDAHPDVSSPKDGYPYAHAFVLGALLGSNELSASLHNKSFKGDEVFYIGLQGLHEYQEQFLQERGINYTIQDKSFVSNEEIQSFIGKFKHILVHFDIDVLSPKIFHSTYFANPDLVGDGSSSGKMSIEELKAILELISKNAHIVGFSIAEYLPFDEHKLSQIFERLEIFK